MPLFHLLVGIISRGVSFSRMFWRIWLLHGDVQECRNSDEQNDASERDQGNWQCLQHVCFVLSLGELVKEELVKDHFVEGEVEMMND